MIPAAAIRWSPGIRWSPAFRWSPAIRWSIRSMDFDNRKVYGDTSITDGLVWTKKMLLVPENKCETSSKVFILKEHGKNSHKINVFPWQSTFLDFSFWIEGHRTVQRAHYALAQYITQVSQNRLADPGGWTRSVLSLISTCYILSFVKLSQCRNFSMTWFRKIFFFSLKS